VRPGQGYRCTGRGGNKTTARRFRSRTTRSRYTLGFGGFRTKDIAVFTKGRRAGVGGGSWVVRGFSRQFFRYGYRQNLTGSFQRRDRIDLAEVEGRSRGDEGVADFKDSGDPRFGSFTGFHSASSSDSHPSQSGFEVDPKTRRSVREIESQSDQADSRFTHNPPDMQTISARAPLRALLGPFRPGGTHPHSRYLCLAVEDPNPNEAPAIKRRDAYYMADVRAMRKKSG